MKIYTEHSTNNDEFSSYIIHCSYNSPVFFIASRDIVDKRIEFYNDSKFYLFSTSINPECDCVPKDENVVRCLTYINTLTISEDEDAFYLSGYNQCDVHVRIM
jgi:hypothetical protein